MLARLLVGVALSACTFACGASEAPPAVPGNAVPAAPRDAHVSRARQLLVELLGRDLVSDGIVSPRISAAGDKVFACVTEPNADGDVASSCEVDDLVNPRKTWGIAIIAKDEARGFEAGTQTAEQMGLTRDAARAVRSRFGPDTRPLRRMCSADQELSCEVLDATVTIDEDDRLTIVSNGNTQTFELYQMLGDAKACLVHVVHAEVWADLPTRTLLVLKNAVLRNCRDASETPMGSMTKIVRLP